MTNEIKLIITADDKAASAALKNIENTLKSTAGAAHSTNTPLETMMNKFKSLASDADNFKFKLGGLGSAFTAIASAVTAFAGIQIFRNAIDEAEKYQNSLMGLAVAAQYTGEGIDETVDAARKLTQSGLLTMSDAAKGIKNLLTYGFTLEETNKLMKVFTDAAVFNREAHYTLSEAVAVTTEGIKNENSRLSDAAGLGKNIGQIFEEYAQTLGKTTAALSQAEKRQAILNGFLKEGEAYAGNADIALKTLTGTKSKLSSEISILKAQLGETLIPVFLEFAKILNWLMQDVIKPFIGGIEMLGARMGMWAEKMSVYWQAILSGKGIAGALRDSKDKLKELEKLYEDQAAAISQKWAGKFELPIIPKDTGKRRQDIENINKDLKKLADEWERVKAKLQADIDKTGVDEFQKKLIDLRLEFDNLIKKFGAKPEIQAWFDEMTRQIQTEQALAQYKKMYEEQEKIAKAEQELQKNLTLVYATEIEKREIELQEWTQKQMQLAHEAFTDIETLEKRITDIIKAETAQREKNKLKALTETAEKEIAHYQDAVNLSRRFGETELEYAKRTLAAKERNISKLKEFAKQLQEAGLEGEKAYKTIIELIEELEDMQKALNATFQDGIEHGIKEYLEELEDMYQKGRDLAKSTAIAVENALTEMFDNPKNALDNLFKYFVNILKRMIAQALANPIIIPIQTMMTGMMGGLIGTGIQGGMMQGGLLSSILPYLGFAGLGAGIGGMMFGGNLGAMIGGGLGGLGGGLLGSTFATQIGTTIIGALGGQVSGAIGAAIFSAIPVLGTIIGGLLGSWLGSLFKKKKFPEMFLEFQAGADPNAYNVGKHWTGGAMGVEGGLVGFGYKNVGDWSQVEQQILKLFADARSTVMQELEALGLDISGFFKDWKKWFPDLTGKTAEEIQAMLKEAIGEYMQFASGIDFSQWQKSGEDLLDTISRILTAFKAFPSVLENIQDYIDAINNQTDDVAKWKNSLREASEKIADMWKELEKMTDPADVLNMINQLKQATYEYYMSQIQFVQQLDATIKQLEIEMLNFQIQMQMKISDLTGNFGASITAISNAMANALQKFEEAQTPGEKLTWLQQYISMLDQWVAENIAAIQARYQAEINAINSQISALQKQKEIINKQLEGLREQLRITQTWKNVLESIKKQILDMHTTLANQQDVFDRMDILRAEMERIKGLYAAATGEDKAKYAQQLASLIQQYMGLAGEAFQRPSPEYQAIWKEMLEWLEMIQKDAEDFSKSETELLAEIKAIEEQSKAIDEQIRALQAKANDLTEQMHAEIEAYKQSSVQYYEWAMNEGMRLYQEKLDMLKEKLGEILGELTLQEYIALKQKEATEALQALKDWADNYWENLKATLQETTSNPTTPIPSPSPTPSPSETCPICNTANGQHQAWCPYAQGWHGAAGGYVTKPTKMIVGEAGPEWIIPLSRMKEFQNTNITVAPSITINATSGANAKDIAEEIERQIIYSLKYGKGRAIIKEARA